MRNGEAVQSCTKSKARTILLVEDSPGDVRLTREALRESSAQVVLEVARDGVEAMEMLRGENTREGCFPDLILLDLNLPRKDGREVLAEIKADPHLRLIPVVVLTTSTADSDIQHAYELHANCYVSKPADVDEYFLMIRRCEEFWFKTATLPKLEPLSRRSAHGPGACA
ncbi:MAG: response regulator [Bryobacteraceae bacterium]|nr:response regulator [Bryobacterales bacterium]MEB2362327.1 response regulator [Bryobacterales bacterium]NUN01440.1 response regulator [Bryobacteraceae bacterium]